LRAHAPSLLRGLLFDAEGNPFTPSHTVRHGKRYRYYVSQKAIQNPGTSNPGLVRLSAKELENLVLKKLRSVLESPATLIDVIGLSAESAATTKILVSAAAGVAQKLASGTTVERRSVLETFLSRIVVRKTKLEVVVDRQKLQAEIIGSGALPQNAENQFHTVVTDFDVTLGRYGSRLVLVPDGSQSSNTPVLSLVKAVARARDWYERIIRGEISGSRAISRLIGMEKSYVRRILQAGFVAPEIVDTILAGSHPAALTIDDLVELPMQWDRQRSRIRCLQAKGRHVRTYNSDYRVR